MLDFQNNSAGITAAFQDYYIGVGSNGVGQVVILFGSGDPNSVTDASLNGAAVGSLWSRLDGPDSTRCLYVKTALPNTWTAK